MGAPGRGEVRAPWEDAAGAEGEDPQVALGRKLLEAFEAEMAAQGGGRTVTLPADYGQGLRGGEPGGRGRERAA